MILVLPLLFLLSFGPQGGHSKRKEVFPNSVYNEATIYDFVADDIFFEVIEPVDLQYSYRLRKARNFGTLFQRQYNGVPLVLAEPKDCCSLPSNADELHQSVALVVRGHCSFVSKAIKAEKAGAIAVIIMDNNESNDDIYIEMIDDNTNRQLTIPAAFLLGKSGHVLLRRLSTHKYDTAIINIPVNLTSAAINKMNQPPWILW